MSCADSFSQNAFTASMSFSTPFRMNSRIIRGMSSRGTSGRVFVPIRIVSALETPEPVRGWRFIPICLKIRLLMSSDVGLLYSMNVGFLQDGFSHASTENAAGEDRGAYRKEASR